MTIKVLVIAPSEAIKDSFLEISKKFPEIELTIKVANLANAVPLVKSAASQFDLIIARGETAIIIKKTVTTPVVEIPISGPDILSAITQAEQLKMPFAVMGYASMTNNAKRIKDLLKLDIEIFTISQFSEMEYTLKTIKNNGYRIVVCGMGAADNIARRVGLNPINVMTSAITVDETLNRACFIGRIIVEGKERTKFFLHLTEISGKKYIVYSQDYVQVFNSFEDDCTIPIQICEKLLPNVTEERQIIKRNINGQIYDIDQSMINFGDERYMIFAFDIKKTIISPQKGGVRVYSKDTVYTAFLTHYPQFSDTSKETLGIDLSVVSKTNIPILILGEPGTGKEQIASLIYINSQFSNHPYYLIDAEEISDKNWNNLIYGEESVFVQTGITIYLRNVDKLSQTRLNQIKTLVIDSQIETRNKLIFSVDTIPGAKTNEAILDFINTIGASTISLKPLRQRSKEEFLTLITLYINTLDEKYGRNVVGMTKEAEDLFLSYQWPDNLQQLRRVITDIVINTETAYIQAEQVEKSLEAEKSKLTSSLALTSVIDINKKMSEIEKDVARAVLLKSNGNQSLAAQRLGISRTTIWRLLS